VDVPNFSGKTNYRGLRDTLHLIERFTRTADGLRYEVTADDPQTWTKPWTAALDMAPTGGRVVRVRMSRGQQLDAQHPELLSRG
jgi:hypothetical protein